MGFYNVVRPCVVGKLHYATVPVQPIEVDDEVAAPLVESGCLESYPRGSSDAIKALTLEPRGIEGNTGDSLDGVIRTVEDFGDPVVDPEPESEKPSPRPRNPRRPKD